MDVCRTVQARAGLWIYAGVCRLGKGCRSTQEYAGWDMKVDLCRVVQARAGLWIYACAG